MARALKTPPEFPLVEMRQALADARSGKLRTPAYAHALGFIHVALPSLGGRKLRLHIWPSQGLEHDGALSQIHNHGFRFRSFVLTGAVEHRPYDIEEGCGDQQQDRMRLFTVQQDAEQTHLVATDQFVTAHPCRARIFLTGEAYEFAEGKFHTSRKVGSGVTTTLLVAEKIKGVPSYVLVPASQCSTITWHKQWLSRQFVSALLEQVEARLLAYS